MMYRMSVACILIILTAGTAVAQDENRTSFIRGTDLFSGLHLEYWSYAETHSFETVLPIYYSMDLNNYVEGLAVDLVSSPTFGMVAGRGIPEGNSVLGITGTKMRASYNFRDMVLATFGVQAPTGRNNLSASQTDVVGALSSRHYRFKVNRIGTGWDLDFTLSSSMEITDDFMTGLGFGYLLHGPYAPFDVQGTSRKMDEFNPGNEISAVLGLDYTLFAGSRKFNILGDVVYTLYTRDKFYVDDSLDITNEFDSGDRIDVNFSVGTKLSSRHYNTLSAAFIIKQKSELDIYQIDWLTGNWISSNTKIKEGNEIRISDGIHFLNNKKYRPYAVLQISKFFADEGPVGNAFTVGTGGGGILKLSDNMSIQGRLLVDIGRLNQLWLFGFEISGGLNYDF